MSDRDPSGWFADVTDDEAPNVAGMWQAFCEIDGCCLPLPIWFKTEADCDAFIANIPAGPPLDPQETP